jgi:quercetin dioxygenase-like cupin family protein
LQRRRQQQQQLPHHAHQLGQQTSLMLSGLVCRCVHVVVVVVAFPMELEEGAD